ncbi:MAG: hypothetical protein AABO41_25905 [Acidobacteriota bacterium]
MKTIQSSNQSQQSETAILLALQQVAELARELCRPDFSEVDNAIGRYLLDTVQPLLPGPATAEAPPVAKPRSPRRRLARLLGRRRGEDGQQPASVIGNGQPLNFADCVPFDGAGGAVDPRYEIVEPETYVSVH